MRFRKLLLLAVLSLAGSTVANGQRLPSGVSGEEVTLYARVLAMTDIRQLDTAVVARALSSRWQPLRTAATLAIGQIGEPGLPGAARLRALLKDSDANVAGNAAYALGLLRDTAAIADLAVALTAIGSAGSSVGARRDWRSGARRDNHSAQDPQGSRRGDPVAARRGEAASGANH
jgi:hypothetical protein